MLTRKKVAKLAAVVLRGLVDGPLNHEMKTNKKQCEHLRKTFSDDVQIASIPSSNVCLEQGLTPKDLGAGCNITECTKFYQHGSLKLLNAFYTTHILGPWNVHFA